MIRVLYVTGWCRTGSTLLGNLLGELPGVVHVGELHYLWRNGVLAEGTNRVCGCGQAVTRCPLWAEVLARVAGPDRVAYAKRAAADQQAYLRTRHTGRRLAESLARRTRRPEVTAPVDRMVRLYQAMAEVGGVRLLVDSSKYPAEPAAVCRRPELDLRVLHLIRDPRGTAHSWRRAKAYIPAMGVLRSSAYWTGFNLASERLAGPLRQRYLRLRYEDFARHPRHAVARVLALAGLDDAPPVGPDGEAELSINHTVTGNPDRLVPGPVRIRPDEAWRRELPPGPSLAATVVAGPLLRRYGYPVRPGREP